MQSDREHIIQATLIVRVKSELEPRYPEVALLYAIPNGGHRHISVAAKLKAEGVKRGVPDLCLPLARGGHFGLYLEMKAQDGRVRPEQKQWLTALRENGYLTRVAFSDDEAMAELSDYLAMPATLRGQTTEDDLRD